MFYKRLSVIEIENSTICNARCPQCLREELGPDGYEQTYLPVEFFENNIPQHVYDQLEKIHFGGTLGDPCSAPNFLEVIDVVKKKNPNTKITVSTNGGMKTAEWWTALANKLSPNDRILFAIDGLEDTNHIYRVNVSWNNLIKNVRAFIDAGGNAGWQFIVFKHNQHQKDEARLIAKELGFKEFVLKKSHRFPMSEVKGIKIVGSDNITIEPSTDPEFISVPILMPKPATWREETAHLKINCDAQQEQSAYIDVQGRLYPCCYIASAVHQYDTPMGRSVNQGWTSLWTEYGDSKINLNHHSWNEVIDGMFFKEVKRKWDDDRIVVCTFFCGANAKSPWSDTTDLKISQST